MLPKACRHVAGAARSAVPLPGAALWRAAAAARPGHAARRQLRCAAMDRQQQMDRAPPAGAEQQQAAVEPHLECFGTGMEVECRLVQDGPPHVPVPGEDPAVVSRSSSAAAATAAQQQPQEQDNGEGQGRVAGGIVFACLLSCPCHCHGLLLRPSQRSHAVPPAVSGPTCTLSCSSSYLQHPHPTAAASLCAGPLEAVLDAALLVSPFFFWGTSMVAMKQLAPHTTPLLVAAWRLIPAGAALLLWARQSGRQTPTDPMAWVAMALFGLVDGACFQVGLMMDLFELAVECAVWCGLLVSTHQRGGCNESAAWPLCSRSKLTLAGTSQVVPLRSPPHSNSSPSTPAVAGLPS